MLADLNLSSHLEIDTQGLNMNADSVIKPYACHHCGKTYSRRYNLRRHVENAHGANDSKMDDGDSDHAIGVFGTDNFDVDDYQPGLKRRRFQDSETNSCETESTTDEDDSEESDEELESEGENDDSSEEDESSSDLEDNTAY